MGIKATESGFNQTVRKDQATLIAELISRVTSLEETMEYVLEHMPTTETEICDECINDMGIKEAITQLEIIATNMVGRLCEIPNEDEKQIAILNKQIEALDMGIDALRTKLFKD